MLYGKKVSAKTMSKPTPGKMKPLPLEKGSPKMKMKPMPLSPVGAKMKMTPMPLSPLTEDDKRILKKGSSINTSKVKMTPLPLKKGQKVGKMTPLPLKKGQKGGKMVNF
jgi:hypothetical protein